MFVRLRDLADAIRYDFTKYYIDPCNCKIYWELYVDVYYEELPFSVRERLLRVPPLYTDNLYEIVYCYIEKEKNNLTKLAEIISNTSQEQLVCKTLSFIDDNDLWDDWNSFAKKYLISKLKVWCINNSLPFGM